MIKIKNGAIVPKTLVILAGFTNAFHLLALKGDVTITSGSDGAHSSNSKHYTNEALDFRTRELTATDIVKLAQETKKRLGKEYDVVIERDHIHIEYDPKES